MADETTNGGGMPMKSMFADPFFMLTGQIEDIKTKISNGIFEAYKLQVEQTNDINNRAMQVQLNNSSSLAALKQAVSAGTLQTMLAASRTDAAVGITASATQRAVLEQGELTRRLAIDQNTQNLNTALVNTNTALVGSQGQITGLGMAYSGAIGAYQNASTVSAINATNSALAGNGIVNTGEMADVGQVATPTTIG